MLNKFEKDLENWGVKVCEECKSFIQSGKTEQDFYVFQSSIPKESPSLLLVGINPGGNKTYEQQVTQYRNGKDRKTLTDIAQGYNIYKDFENNRYQSSALSRIKSLSHFIQEDKVTGINACYFNSTHAKDLSSDVFNFCSKFTKELLEILQPKRIIFLTTNSDNLRRVGVKNIKMVGAYVKEGLWQGRKIYAIPNHGYFKAYSYESSNKISEIIKEYLL